MMNEEQGYPPDLQVNMLWRWQDVLLIILGIGLIFGLGIAGIFVFHAVPAASANGQLQPTLLLSALLGGLEGAALIGSVYLLGIRRRGLGWKAVKLRRPSDNWLLASLGLGALAIPLSSLVAAGVQTLLGLPLTNPQLPFLAPEGFSWAGMISMFVLGGLVAPFGEELFFRGVLYRWIRDRWGVGWGIGVSSVIFGVLHGELSLAVAAALLGVILAWVYERSQSLWSPVLIHVINNGFKILVLYILLANGGLPSGG
jgi:membrane protease YdiL (CAAX protease family)